MEKEKLRSLAIGFFRGLKCEVVDKGDCILIENVPSGFEDFYGKKGPYNLVFGEGSSEGELVVGGSSIFNAMTRYLKKGGSTTLLRIDFDIDSRKELEKFISLKNCSVGNLVKKHKNNFFSRFSFLTEFQYLNEKEKVMNEIYIHEGEIVRGDLEGYTVLEGKREEVNFDEVKEDYELAKERVKELIKPKISEIQNKISEAVEFEVDKVRGHYNRQILEIGDKIEKSVERIKGLKDEYLKSSDSDILKKIARLKHAVQEINEAGELHKIRREEDRAIKDLLGKHSVDVKNKLINTTVIYYPIFSFSLSLENNAGKRLVELEYNPLTKSLEPFNCEACSKEISVLNLCSNGHIVCSGCLEKCGECGKQFCENCVSKCCSLCGKKLCKTCLQVCRGCGGYVCNDHLRKDCVTGEERCLNCLRACMRCHGFTEEKYFGEAKDRSKICQKCLATENRGSVLKEIFDR